MLVSLSDSHDSATSPADESGLVHNTAFGPPPILGDALALLSALFYAFYVTLLKVRVREESRVDMQLFFGFVGAFNIVAVWPLGVILHLTGIEPFELPQNSRAVWGLLINVRPILLACVNRADARCRWPSLYPPTSSTCSRCSRLHLLSSRSV